MTLRHSTDPIIAIATAPGRGAVGIVRVSGPALDRLIEAVCGRSLAPRHATYLPFNGADGQPIDQGLALHFPAPHSYTGEDVLELHVHGGAVVLQLLLARCLEVAARVDPISGAARLPNLRLAEPGEFTLRAFLNDKLDLAQAEAVADLIDASTEASARSAARSLAGAFSVEVDLLRQRIVTLRMLVEATLDFPDEEIDFLQQADARGKLDAIVAALAGVLERARQGALLREGLQVVLAGQPNVGKSSLLNALAGAELAIVTAIPGTTRDKVSQTIQIEGVPLHVVDTAGLRDIGSTLSVSAAGAEGGASTDAIASVAGSSAVRPAEEARDEVERIGIARSWEAIGQADAVIFLHDLTRRGQPDYEAAEAAIAARLQLGDPNGTDAPRRMPRILHVHNKVDALPAGAPLRPAPAAADVVLSARTGAGLDALRQALLQCVGWHATPAEGVFIARQRHVDALQRTRAHLRVAQARAAQGDTALDLMAEELRLAHDALAEITGAFSSDDLLGEIFGRFCLGK